MMADLLEQEHAAALRADVQALAEIQDEKRGAVERLRASNPSNDIITALEAATQRNIALIRHLVRCLRAVTVEPAELAYSAAGTRVEAHVGCTRARL